jgi:hypothetical protein
MIFLPCIIWLWLKGETKLFVFTCSYIFTKAGASVHTPHRLLLFVALILPARLFKKSSIFLMQQPCQEPKLQ